MTVEQMYERTLKCVNMMNDLPNEKEFILKILKGGDKLTNKYNLFPVEMANLLIDLKEQMITKEYKTSGRSGLLRCGKFILKDSKKRSYSEMPINKSCVINDVQIITNGHIALLINNQIDVPTLEENQDKIMFENIYRQFHSNYINEQIREEKELQLPTIGELKAYISEQKVQSITKIYWDFGKDLPTVDAVYLLKILEIKQNVKMYHNTKLTPLVFTFDDGEGILMPVKKPN